MGLEFLDDVEGLIKSKTKTLTNNAEGSKITEEGENTDINTEIRRVTRAISKAEIPDVERINEIKYAEEYLSGILDLEDDLIRLENRKKEIAKKYTDERAEMYEKSKRLKALLIKFK